MIYVIHKAPITSRICIAQNLYIYIYIFIWYITNHFHLKVESRDILAHFVDKDNVSCPRTIIHEDMLVEHVLRELMGCFGFQVAGDNEQGGKMIWCTLITRTARYLPGDHSMMGRPLRDWPSIDPALGWRITWGARYSTQLTRCFVPHIEHLTSCQHTGTTWGKGKGGFKV